MERLQIYNAVRAVPEEAKRTITAGRTKGFTDINPMWRIKTLTEQFGPCGKGWYYDIVEHWIETSMASDVITVYVKINLYVKYENEWSKPIQGIGGNTLVASEKSGLYVNDECYKSALTDAISVSCKALGIGADVYWNQDKTKYDADKGRKVEPKKQPEKVETKNMTRQQMEDKIVNICDAKHIPVSELCKKCGVNELSELSENRLPGCISWLESM